MDQIAFQKIYKSLLETAADKGNWIEGLELASQRLIRLLKRKKSRNNIEWDVPLLMCSGTFFVIIIVSIYGGVCYEWIFKIYCWSDEIHR